MPVVISADNERLGWSAIVALEQWRFDPPLRKGKPVLVRSTQTFRFEPESK
jgi:outer membrane biosynthesis protein TonB